MLNIIDINRPKQAVRFLKYFCYDYRWIQNDFHVIEKAELCLHFCTPQPITDDPSPITHSRFSGIISRQFRERS